MTDGELAGPLRERIFSSAEANVFAVLDGASATGLVKKLWEHKAAHYCLFPGELEPDMAEVAPYVVELGRDAKFTEWLLSEGWGNHWGIFAVSPADLRTVRGHFRMLVEACDEEGTPMIFRYYDPRVFRVYMPTCDGDQCEEMFGPVALYLLEDEDPHAMLRYALDGGELATQQVPLDASAPPSGD
jgi:hypothetical protein